MYLSTNFYFTICTMSMNVGQFIIIFFQLFENNQANLINLNSKFIDFSIYIAIFHQFYFAILFLGFKLFINQNLGFHIANDVVQTSFWYTALVRPVYRYWDLELIYSLQTYCKVIFLNLTYVKISLYVIDTFSTWNSTVFVLLFWGFTEDLIFWLHDMVITSNNKPIIEI